MVFVTNRLDHIYFSESLENRYIVFKKYAMHHLVNTNNVFHTIFTWPEIRHTFHDPIKKRLRFFKFCPPDMMCMQKVVGYFDACSGLS